MKLLHRNVLTNKHKISQPIHQLMISDPLYDKDVWCRYENNDIDMDRIEIFVRKDKILDHEGEEPLDYGDLIIRLSNSLKEEESDEQKTYEIGVDTARYVLQTEHDDIVIVTRADGTWGEVIEEYYQGELGALNIYLAIPEDYVMPEEKFIAKVLSAFHVEHPEMVVMIDEDMNEEMDSISQDKGMKIAT